MNGGIIWQFPTRSTQSITFRRSTWISLRRGVRLVHWHAPYRLITLVLTSLFIMDIDWVLHHLTLSLWGTFGALICSRFVFGDMFWLCWRCRRNWRFYCFWSAGSLWRTWCLLWWCTYLFFSRVGLSVSSNQVNNFNWTENTFSNTGVWFPLWRISRCRDESECLRVHYIFLWLLSVSLSLFWRNDSLWRKPFAADHNYNTWCHWCNRSLHDLLLHT